MTPNILFLHSHNTGRHVQPYGYVAPTPNLQRLAEQGVLFRQAFAAAPTCSPSRGAFLTGRTPHACGMFGLAHRGFALRDVDLHLARLLKRHGYHTALSGVEHTAPDIHAIGYDQILSDLDINFPGHANDREPAEEAAAFLRSGPPQPFFLSVGLEETHRPFPPAEPDRYPAEDARYCRPPDPLPDTPEIRADMADFLAAVRVMDGKFGLVLDALDEAGLAEDTLVCCFADHGLQFPRHMATLTDRGIGVYLIVRGPGGFSGGRVIDGLVSLLDLAPTVCDLAGIATPGHMQGRSLRPLVSGETESLHDAIFAESNYHAAYEPARCIRTARYKLIRRFDGRDKPVLPNVDNGPAKQALLDLGWREQPREQEMLYDLAFDPGETHNLVQEPALARVLAGLQARLTAWMQETGDPLAVQEVVPAPPGARVDDPDALAPNTILAAPRKDGKP